MNDWKNVGLLQVLIVYGSQTGTAEELSGRLAKDFARYSKKAIIIDPEMLDMDEFAKINGLLWKILSNFWYQLELRKKIQDKCKQIYRVFHHLFQAES